MKKVLSIILGLLVFLAALLFLNKDFLIVRYFEPTKSSLEEGLIVDFSSDTPSEPEVVVSGLNIPWELVFLPNGEMLLTEREGKLIKVGESRVEMEVPEVFHQGEGGLLGLALHPKYEENNFIYLYLTTQSEGVVSNKVVRFRLFENNLTERKVIIEGIPGSRVHDGGRISFGPDGYLYVATGDAGQPNLSQDKLNLAGKILRVGPDGEIPNDNPFANEVYSFGHRNVQGLTWDGGGSLWATEHGRSGVLSGLDELNKIEIGGNYGWPRIQGDEVFEDMIPPVIHSGESETWAPAGIVYFDGRLFFTGLRGQSLYVVDFVDNDELNITRYFTGVYGRLRGVTLGPDGMLYLFTNNRDGRGSSSESDDRVIRVHPKLLVNN